MLPVDDYKTALEVLSNLIADYIHSANTVFISNNDDTVKEWQQKSLYITMMYDLLNSMNGIRQIIKTTNKPATNNYKPRLYNPDNG